LWFKRIQMILDEQDGEDQGDSNRHAKSNAHRCATNSKSSPAGVSYRGSSKPERRRTAIHPSIIPPPLRADQQRFKRASFLNFWVCQKSRPHRPHSRPRWVGLLGVFSNAHRSRTADGPADRRLASVACIGRV
jgi:hypothetical protein